VSLPVPDAPIGVALAVDGNPRYGERDAYRGGVAAVAEAVRNVVATGARPRALTDCLNFGNPENPEHYRDFLDSVRGLADAARLQVRHAGLHRAQRHLWCSDPAVGSGIAAPRLESRMAETFPTSETIRDLPEDLEEAILELKQERNAVLLAHYYQESELQDLADFVGDSLALAQAAAKLERDVIAFCGVEFMAETAKILNPGSTVVIPDMNAGCSLADECPAGEFQAFKEQYLES